MIEPYRKTQKRLIASKRDPSGSYVGRVPP